MVVVTTAKTVPKQLFDMVSKVTPVTTMHVICGNGSSWTDMTDKTDSNMTDNETTDNDTLDDSDTTSSHSSGVRSARKYVVLDNS